MGASHRDSGQLSVQGCNSSFTFSPWTSISSAMELDSRSDCTSKSFSAWKPRIRCGYEGYPTVLIGSLACAQFQLHFSSGCIGIFGVKTALSLGYSRFSLGVRDGIAIQCGFEVV